MKNLFNEYTNNLDTYIMFKIKEKTALLKDELTKKGRAPISLAMGAPTSAPPKFLIESMKKALDYEGYHTYSNPKGEKYLLEAIQKRMKSRFHVEIELGEICSLLGSKEGIANLLRGIISPTSKEEDQDIILIPDPAYASYSEMIKVSGGKSYSIPLLPENNFTPDLNEVYEKLKSEGLNPNKIKALIINYPNNPLGATCDKKYLEHSVDFCKKHDILLISDAAYVDIYWNENEKPSSVLEIEGAKDISVEFHSFSKPYSMTGWRIGWVCGNKEVVQKFAKLKSTIDSGIFKPIQYAAAEILNSKDGDKYIIEENLKIKEKSEYFTELLETELGWKSDYNFGATFYKWLKVPEKFKDAYEFCDKLLETSGVVMVPGDAFGKCGAGYVRASLVCTKEDLKEVVKRLKEDGFANK